MPTTHQNRVAVITGAARGIGQAAWRQPADRGATMVAANIEEPTETLELLNQAGHTASGSRHRRRDILVDSPTITPGEYVRSSRRWAERRYSSSLHLEQTAGGSVLVVLEQPDLLVEQIRATFRSL